MSKTSNCDNESIDRIPFTDPGGEGLYINGLNTPPDWYHKALLARAGLIQKLDTAGQPAETGGKIVVAAHGFSNQKQEHAKVLDIIRGGGIMNKAVAYINAAQGGYDSMRMADPNTDYWLKADQLMTNRGVSRHQVQVTLLKVAVAGETDPAPDHIEELQGYIAKIWQTMRDWYPNLRFGLIVSRTYGDYAVKATSPEPWAFEGAYAVKGFIEDEIDAAQPADLAQPLPAWGPYLWTNGMEGRGSDGMIWTCSDVEDDGVHPSPSGELKVANLWINHFQTSPYTTWFLPTNKKRRAAVRQWNDPWPRPNA